MSEITRWYADHTGAMRNNQTAPYVLHDDHVATLTAERTAREAAEAAKERAEAECERLRHRVRKQAHEWEAHPYMPLDMGTAARCLRQLLASREDDATGGAA